MADKTTTYGIKVKAESNAGQAADSVSALQKQLLSSQGTLKSYQTAMRNLKGDSEAVKSAKEKLQVAEKATKDSISATTVKLLQHNASLKASAPAAAETGSALGGLSSALSGVGGVATAAAGILMALAAALVGGTIAIVKFIFEASNANRTFGLFREAATGSAANAKAFGEQIRDIGLRVPQSRAELEKLSVSVSKQLINTRISGQGIVDTFNAVAQASAAMGDDVGRQIEGLITRGKRTGRFQLDLFDLEGTGLKREDVAEQLSKQLGIGIGDAKQRLMMGSVSLSAGAAALRAAVEKKFAPINLRQMLDLNVMVTKFKDTLADLTSGIKLEGLATALGKIAENFSDSTVSGRALKSLITDFGNAVAYVMTAAGPQVDVFVRTFILSMLKLEIAALKIGIFMKERFGVDFSKAMGDTSVASYAAQAAVFALVAALGTLAIVGAIAASIFYPIYKGGEMIAKFFEGKDWSKLGKSILDGIVNGLLLGLPSLLGQVEGCADKIKKAFKDVLGIHSPSKVFEQFGAMTAEGYAQGVEGGQGRSQDAVAGLPGRGAPGPVEMRSESGSSRGPVTLNVNITVEGGGDAADKLMSPTFKAQFLKALEEMIIGAGLAPQGGV